ncbi:MAG: CHAT domain-containing protein, partial [Chitinophagaceae bacterium]
LSYYQQAIHQFYPAFKEENVHANPENFSGIFSYINLFHALNGKAAAWHNIYLQKKKAIAPAKEELNTYKSAFKLIEYVERTYDSDEARLFLSKIKHAAHGKPIDIAAELYAATKDKAFIETLYYFDQQNKGAILSLNRQLNATVSEKASTEQQKEQLLKTEITRLSIRATQVQDSLQLVAINNTIRDHEISLGKLKESRNAPLSSKEDNIPSINSLQTQLLDDKTALVSYHLSEEKLTTTVLTKSSVDCFQQRLPENFLEDIQEEIIRTKTPTDSPVRKGNFDYFDFLLANVPLKKIDQLVIIPDDLLAYFPFESLQDTNGKYLVESVAVQYQYSTSLLQENHIDFSHARTLAFAPFANRSYDSLPMLTASAEEVADTKGELFINDQATKEAFLKNSSNFQIIHLATHAVANSSAENLSYIAFAQSAKNQNLLYTQEIYNLPLSKTGLVILSACETGTGQLVKGEGILSLSRAFSYAGCPNTITSLWKANDFSTAYLTKRIYHYLNSGKSIAKAVQQAKKDYLADKSINPRLKQPYYWAHLIFMGNYTPAKDTNWFALMAPALFILLLLLALKSPAKPGKWLA